MLLRFFVIDFFYLCKLLAYMRFKEYGLCFLKLRARTSCFRTFFLSYNAFDGPIRNKIAAQCHLFSISRPLHRQRSPRPPSSVLPTAAPQAPIARAKFVHAINSRQSFIVTNSLTEEVYNNGELTAGRVSFSLRSILLY